MSLMDAPSYDPTNDNRIRNLSIAAAALVVLLIILSLAGRMTGHGWLFTNLPAERKVDQFFTALQNKDYGKAYGLYTNDPDWQQHLDKHTDYPEKQFVDDWTTDPRNFYPIVSHHVDASAVDGTGFFGTGTIVAVRVNSFHKLFMYVNRADGTMTWPAPHIIVYD